MIRDFEPALRLVEVLERDRGLLNAVFGLVIRDFEPALRLVEALKRDRGLLNALFGLVIRDFGADSRDHEAHPFRSCRGARLRRTLGPA